MPGIANLKINRARFVFVHYHIFKNGGTTLESILRRQFGEGFTALEGAADDSILTGEDLAEFLTIHPEITAISSHQLRYPKPSVPRTVIFDCCFLRHPLDRLMSVYTYFRGIESPDRLCYRARRQSPREFMEQTLQESPHLISNVQVTLLASGGAFFRPASERDLDRATEIFCDMALPGLVDMFPESLVAAEYFLKPAFPEIRLEHVPHNVSRKPVRRHAALSHQMVEEDLKNLWGEDLYADIARLNQFDLELYRRAQSEIRRRLFLVPALDERLEDFSYRCAALNEAGALPQPQTEETQPAKTFYFVG
ncbi:MAG TPA: hypothetical protein VG273_21340 [Bryobacteraceae bacterium]|nr:hypothetical protein [Bryobacteraceae bacterium]